MAPAEHTLRSQFPVLERMAYLNAGTDGPVPRRGAEAAAERIRAELEHGRAGEEHMDTVTGLIASVRAQIAALMGAQEGEVAVTHSTTDGLNTVLLGLDLRAGDEVLTSDEEHPGLLAPLAHARRRSGIEVRIAPFDELAQAVGPRTRLVAASHVSWVSGRVLDTAALRSSNAALLLDGAQGLGAVPVDVLELGVDFYAASGQKWLCGPDASGYLYVRKERIGDVAPPWLNYMSLADAARAAELDVHPDARRFDLGLMPTPATAWALASLDVLADAGWAWVHDRARALAATLAAGLQERGITVAARGDSTLVAWHSADPEADVVRLASDGLVVRAIPGRGLVRASVGAWSSEDELERLTAAA